MPFQNIYTFICEYYFQNHAYWYIYFVIFHNLFGHNRNFRGRPTSSSIEMQKGVHGQRKFGKTCPKPKPGQQRQTINKSVCCFDVLLAWFTDLHGNKGNGI